MSKKKINVEVNSQIKEALKSKNVPLHDGIGYLLCVYYGVTPSYFPEELVRRVLSSGIVSVDYSNDTVTWNTELFEEAETGFEWIPEWMDLFKSVNPERRGVKADVLRRMKKFFINNPAIRKDQVFEATKAYLKTVDNPMYCKKSHKFIYEMDGSSMLGDYVERLETIQAAERTYEDDII